MSMKRPNQRDGIKDRETVLILPQDQERALLHLHHRPDHRNLWDLPWVIQVHPLQSQPTHLHLDQGSQAQGEASADRRQHCGQTQQHLCESGEADSGERWAYWFVKFPAGDPWGQRIHLLRFRGERQPKIAMVETVAFPSDRQRRDPAEHLKIQRRVTHRVDRRIKQHLRRIHQHETGNNDQYRGDLQGC